MQAALAAGKAARDHYDGVDLVRFSDRFAGTPRGTVVVEGRVVPTYPRIGRFFVLAEGIRTNFSGSFSVEEKIDGYNVRILRHRGRLLALGRGGGVCPFTMDRLPDLADLGPVFDAHPDLILCCEVAGPNPYLRADPPRARDRLRMFVFDVMQVAGGTVEPVPFRDAVLDRFDLPRVPVLGVFTAADTDAVAALVRTLDAEGGEGIVLKSLEDDLRAKYVTPSINLRDIEVDAELIPELPGEFFSSRLVRIALGLDEIGTEMSLEEVEQRLGHALIRGLRDALRDVGERGVVARRFTVRLRNRETAAALVDHIDRGSRTVQARQISCRAVDGYWELTFEKIFQTSTGKLHTWLRGQLVVD